MQQQNCISHSMVQIWSNLQLIFLPEHQEAFSPGRGSSVSTHSGPRAHTGLQSPLHSVLDSPGPERSLQNQMNPLLSLMKPCADTSLPLLLHYGKIFSHDIIALDFRVRRLNMFPPGSHVTFGFHGSPAARDAF